MGSARSHRSASLHTWLHAAITGETYNGRELGAPGRIRTCDLQIRSLLLYPLSYERLGCTDTPPRRCWPSTS